MRVGAYVYWPDARSSSDTLYGAVWPSALNTWIGLGYASQSNLGGNRVTSTPRGRVDGVATPSSGSLAREFYTGSDASWLPGHSYSCALASAASAKARPPRRAMMDGWLLSASAERCVRRLRLRSGAVGALTKPRRGAPRPKPGDLAFLVPQSSTRVAGAIRGVLYATSYAARGPGGLLVTSVTSTCAAGWCSVASVSMWAAKPAYRRRFGRLGGV